MSYLPCELHCHTIHSDGGFTPLSLQQAAVEDHLSLIALTDHNTYSGFDETDPNLIPVVRGIEWTTYFGHMLVLGARDFVDWRDAVPDNIDEKMKAVRAAGGVVGIAHPFQAGSPICTGGRWEFHVRDFRNVDYKEVWHEDFSPENTENDRALAMYTSLLDQGYHIAAVYGKDWHRPTPPEKHYGCTYLHFDGGLATPQGALKAIRLGKTVASTGAKFIFRVHRLGKTYGLGSTIPKGNVTFSFFTDLHSREKNAGKEILEYKTIRIVTNGGKTVLETRCDTRHERLKIERGHWYRAELWGTVNGENKILAVTSPVYCE